jgi:phosphopentomutase
VIAGPGVRGGRPLGTRSTFADLGATVCDFLGVAREGLAGTSALPEVVK